MNKYIVKALFSLCLVVPVVAFSQDNQFQYFDCWMENINRIDLGEQIRLKIEPKKFAGSTWLCGCYTVREKGGFGWREGDGSPKIIKVWDEPKFELYGCRSKSCETNGSGEFDNNLDQCVNYLNGSAFSLALFAEGEKLNKVVAQKFPDDGSLTDFGKYFMERLSRAASIPCFFQYHERPDAPKMADWGENGVKGVFSISGVPHGLVPDAIGRFTDYSDVRCKDGNVWTGFLTNGYVENVMSVDSAGRFHGTATNYGNDPRYPDRQGPEYGKVLWSAEYRHGNREGIAKFYRYGAIDNAGKESDVQSRGGQDYYFKHLEVPYRSGKINGTVNMFSDKGMLMAKIPFRNNSLEGRITVLYPFDKKTTSINYKNGVLNGPNDFGYFFSNYRNGKVDGKKIEFKVTEKCYDWIPLNAIDGTEPGRSNRVCRADVQGKQKFRWGTYKNGELQGLVECANGVQGTEEIDCDHPY